MRLFTSPLCLGIFLFSKISLGQNLNNFLNEHIAHIQDYIMSGFGGGWTNCDVLSLKPTGVDAPHFLMKFEAFNKLNIRSALSSCQCLVASYKIDSRKSLSAIIKLGWKVVKQHKRIALILSLENGVTLDMVTDKEKENMPFLIAARLDSGEGQYLCPVVGRVQPLLQGHICDISYASYKYKKLRVGLMGMPPHILFTKSGIYGTDVRLLSLLAKKFKFMPAVVVPRTFTQGANMVKKRIHV